MINNERLRQRLSQRLHIKDIQEIIANADKCGLNPDDLIQYAASDAGRTGYNALWVISYMRKSESEWLRSKQDCFIDLLLNERHTGKKRILLQILRDIVFDRDNIRVDFLDYCLSKINSHTEPYTVRAYSIYCSFNLCKFHPELTSELHKYLDLLDTQQLSPGLRCASRATLKEIGMLESRAGKTEFS